MQRSKTGAVAVAFLVAIGSHSFLGSARAEILITEQEAMRPAAAAAKETARGIFRAPRIQLVSPSQAEPVTSPVNLKLKFESFGGTKIDQDSIKVIYLKTPAVDLTPRLKKHLKGSAIEMEVAEAPPGEHRLKIEVKDSDGHLGTADVVLKITK